jgi:DNA polymerase III subunit delta
MSTLKSEDVLANSAKKLVGLNGLLLFGSDAESVGVLARQIQRVLSGAGNFGAAVNIDRVGLKENPSRISDEFKAMSLLGERSIIVCDDADDNLLKLMEDVLSATYIGNFVLLLAGSLSKTSKLRMACEATPLFGCCALYEEEQSALEARIRAELNSKNLKWSKEAEQSFFNRVGNDRATIAQELDKLILYCTGQSDIGENDVNAICGDTASFDADELLDAALAGNMELTDRMLQGFDGDVRTVLIMLLQHVARLQNLRADMENGASLENVVRSARPPIFFKRQNNFKAQLRKFDVPALIALQENVNATILQSRKLPDLADALSNRFLLSLARSAKP